jgi:hypothetical protein
MEAPPAYANAPVIVPMYRPAREKTRIQTPREVTPGAPGGIGGPEGAFGEAVMVAESFR